MNCKHCGAINDNNAWKCAQCGVILQEAPLTGQPIVIPNYLAQAIICTILCCMPLGIPAIVYAAQVSSKIAQGDIEGAKESSKNAKTWCWIAFGAGIIFTIFYLMLNFAPFFLNH